MALKDLSELAQTAIRRVAEIARILGAYSKEPMLTSLGAELWLAGEYLDSVDCNDSEGELPLHIQKLLRHVEKICSWPKRLSAISKNWYPIMEAIAEKQIDTKQNVNVTMKIQKGLLSLASKTSDCEEAIIRLKRIVARGNITRHQADENLLTKSRKNRPVDPHPSEVHAQVFAVLRKHMRCTCEDPVQEDRSKRSHLAKLMLQPVLQNVNDYGQVQFDMLFSSSPAWGEQFDRWQDVELLVAQVQERQKRPNKHARFSSDNNDPGQLSFQERAIGMIDQGEFCKLIKVDTGSRVRLAIQDEKLHRYASSFLKQMVQHLPGISLASALKNYHFSAKMKAVLAYILAHSVWQYYDSDWMANTWTSETIQFIKESGNSLPDDQGQLFPSRPYLSVHFSDEEPWSGEYSTIEGEIHHYPRIRALGIMLVEIGIGSPLPRQDRQHQTQSLAASINEDLLLAIRCLNEEKLWRDFEYPDYRDAVKDCLDPAAFTFIPQNRERENLDGLRQRRDMLYGKAVSRLKELLEGTKWMEQLTQNAVGPLDTSIRNIPVQQVEQRPPIDGLWGRKAPKKPQTEDDKNEKEAKKWLSRMQQLSRNLTFTSGMARGHSSSRVRVAILDTGCDDDSPFFHNSHNVSRLKKWKDYVSGSEEWADSHGHGTHLTSLIMEIATDADVYVARIAADPTGLSTASENVAKAISWASKEWKADIITMSFGYAEEQQCISDAILDALNYRHGSILFFAAASNFGSNQMEMFPASHDSVISIRATNANGRFEDFNPPRNDNETVTFGTLGLKVPEAWLSDHNGEKCQTGTSVAAAIAAGIAALLLGYVDNRTEIGTFSEASLQDVKRRAHAQRGMLALFRALSMPTLNEHYLYLTPWRLAKIPEDERWMIIAGALGNSRIV